MPHDDPRYEFPVRNIPCDVKYVFGFLCLIIFITTPRFPEED
jgi:hypothetical protein